MMTYTRGDSMQAMQTLRRHCRQPFTVACMLSPRCGAHQAIMSAELVELKYVRRYRVQLHAALHGSSQSNPRPDTPTCTCTLRVRMYGFIYVHVLVCLRPLPFPCPNT